MDFHEVRAEVKFEDGFSFFLNPDICGGGSRYTYTYDGENRLTQASGMSGGPWNYSYDGKSLRVKKSNSSGGTLYWRSISGDVLTESDSQGNITNEYVFMAGRRIARRDSSGHVYYYYPDTLGSPMTITDSSGNPCYVATYTPYGQEMATTTTCPQNYKFTGYEQDTETGLYYVFARYYSPRLGRFLSPDPLGGGTSNPQSLNRYAYVMNNPGNFTDPLGLDAGCGNTVFYACNDPWGGATCVIDHFEQFSCGTAAIFLSSGAGYPNFDGWNFLGDRVIHGTYQSNCYSSDKDEIACLGDLISFTAPNIGPSGGPSRQRNVKMLASSLFDALLSDPNCLAFLGAGGVSPLGALERATITTGPVAQDPSVVAITMNSYTPGIVGSTGSTITINDKGFFFQRGFGSEMGPTGTPRFQASSLLHELGYATNVLLPDLGRPAATGQNIANIANNCAKTINSFSPK